MNYYEIKGQSVMNATPTTKVITDLIACHFEGNITRAAQSIGLTQSTLQRIVKGEIIDPKTTQLIPICDYFNISLDSLVGRKELPANFTHLLVGESPSIALQELLHTCKTLSPDDIARLSMYGEFLQYHSRKKTKSKHSW